MKKVVFIIALLWATTLAFGRNWIFKKDTVEVANQELVDYYINNIALIDSVNGSDILIVPGRYIVTKGEVYDFKDGKLQIKDKTKEKVKADYWEFDFDKTTIKFYYNKKYEE